jgi:hypothetical protein
MIGEPDGAHFSDGDKPIYVKGGEEENIRRLGDQIDLGGWARGLTGGVDLGQGWFHCAINGTWQNGERVGNFVHLHLTLKEARALGEFLCERLPPVSPTAPTIRQRLRSMVPWRRDV